MAYLLYMLNVYECTCEAEWGHQARSLSNDKACYIRTLHYGMAAWLLSVFGKHAHFVTSRLLNFGNQQTMYYRRTRALALD